VDKKNTLYNFVNLKSRMCMGVDKASVSPGADLRQFPCDSSANQQWKFGSDGTNPSSLRNYKSKLCLSVDRASVDNGAQLKQFACVNGAPNQSWILFWTQSKQCTRSPLLQRPLQRPASWGSSRSVARGAKGVANAYPQQTAGMSGARCGGGLCAMSEGRSFGGSERQGMPSAARSRHW
jgi:Ricin-type beta-trefoil lectin domain